MKQLINLTMKQLNNQQAMMAIDRTIAGAASGETVNITAPKGSQSQAKGQKSMNIVIETSL